MKSWVKFLIAGLCLVAVVGATIGIVSCNKNKAEEEKTDVLVHKSSVEYFESTQSKTQPAVFSAWAVGTKQFTKVSYQIDTQDEVIVEGATYDVATEAWDNYESDFDGMNYIDTGVITINLSDLNAGKHILTVYVYAGSDARECICEKIFTIG